MKTCQECNNKRPSLKVCCIVSKTGTFKIARICKQCKDNPENLVYKFKPGHAPQEYMDRARMDLLDIAFRERTLKAQGDNTLVGNDAQQTVEQPNS